jgi:hypothetical protein
MKFPSLEQWIRSLPRAGFVTLQTSADNLDGGSLSERHPDFHPQMATDRHRSKAKYFRSDLLFNLRPSVAICFENILGSGLLF